MCHACDNSATLSQSVMARSLGTVLTMALILCGASQVTAQDQSACQVLCAPEFGVEPTVTSTFGAARIAQPDGTTGRDPDETDFEVVLSLDLPTRIPWLGFTIEGSLEPFDLESTPELEFEMNVTWLASNRTGGWLSSHVDLVDDFSPAARPTDRRAYTHKLNFEFAASAAIFNWLPKDRWLRGVEVEGSLDYIATGLPKTGDIIDGVRYIDRASPWSFSFVVAVPIAPF